MTQPLKHGSRNYEEAAAGMEDKLCLDGDTPGGEEIVGDFQPTLRVSEPPNASGTLEHNIWAETWRLFALSTPHDILGKAKTAQTTS